MKKNIVNIVYLVAVLISVTLNQSYAQQKKPVAARIDTSGTLVYPFEDEGEFQYPDEITEGPLYLRQAANIDRKVVYDPETKQYVIYEKVGDFYYRMPKSMSLKEYVQYDFDQSIKEYWRSRKETESIEVERGGLIPQLRIESEAFSSIFGSEIIDIRPQGYVEVQFGLESNYINDPTIPERFRRATTFDFDNQINISVNGKIGDKVDMDFNFNTEATFDFENKMNMEYTGKEDEILRRIEAGNVSLPLNGSLIQGGTNLFGIKTEMQFGKLNVTTVLSQHKGESQVIETEGGAQKTKFEIRASEYDENRHFFISKYFVDHYNEALKSLPLIRSQIVVTRIEVWVTNKNHDVNSSRNIVAFVDLGEIDQNISNTLAEFGGNGSRTPSNSANGMYHALLNNYTGVRKSDQVNRTLEPLNSKLVPGTDWSKIDQARKLSQTEFKFNPQLGFISLNSPLNNDEVLAVAYEYTVGGSAESYKVGEFTNDVASEESLILKLIKGVSLSPESPTWDLMMKNIYNLGAYDLSPSDFDFQVFYRNDSTNSYINHLPEGELQDTILLRLMNLDNMNSQRDYTPAGDGVFDFLENTTVISQSGRIIFPVLEPFGKNISDNLSNDILKEKYAYSKLYTHSKTDAEQDTKHDKFAMIGSYKGTSGSEISLNAFILAHGSVVVSAGGRPLVENEDYTVDYAMGKVKVINQGIIEAGTPIQVSTESQELISTQRKTLIGSYASYKFSEKLNLGGTFLFMNERPITNKVEMGEEPVTNLMMGLDFQYNDRSRLLTDIVNVLPFYDSDVESSISLEGEVAKLVPGRSKSTGNQVYIDDFEGVETSYSFLNAYGWSMASTPQGQDDLFPEAKSDQLDYGYNRAKLAWYFIDREVFNRRGSSSMPPDMAKDPKLRSNHYTRDVLVGEIFPGKDLSNTTVNFLPVLDLAFYPKEKGPYNYDSEASAVSAGVDENNNLKAPETRWGGVMRKITTSNFESSNVEFIEFWVLDPFIYNKDTDGGDLYFNLGNVSEDVLKDSRKAFEHGLPVGELVENVDTTVWGRVTTKTQLGVGFDNKADSRRYQDVGLDCLNNEDEASFFSEYLNRMQTLLSPNAYQKVVADPSNDDFKYYRSTEFDESKASTLERYKNYNNPENNSPTQEMSSEVYQQVGKNDPDIEDINEDYTLSENESYYQYKVSIRPKDMVVGQNFIVDKITSNVVLADDSRDTVTWYQFKIPVTDVNLMDKKVGDISGFKSIRFMRLFLKDFADSVNLRFGTLNLVRSDWRKEKKSLVEIGSNESANAIFDVTSINIEENGQRSPISYILPPGIEREQDPSSPQLVQMNEQSMLLRVKDLEPGDARAVYKDVGVDLRQFKRMQMEVHAEMIDGYPIEDNELSVFIRMGTDEENYYEYEIPLKITPLPTTSYSNDRLADRKIVWPDENRLYVELSKFSDFKLKRDADVRAAGSKYSRSSLYEDFDLESIDGKNIIRIKGNPSLGEVDIVHIGIRNPKKNTNPKSIEVWVNELRVSDFDAKGGWASSGRFSMRLADLGSISLSGRTQSVGWGSINQPASQRSLENKYQYDFAATAELGKLVPEKIGLHLPMFYSHTKTVANPEYNPLSSDIKMADALATIDDPAEKEALKQIAQDVVTRKSFNLSNITIDPVSKKKDRKQLPTDLKNFSLSYAKNEQVSHNIDVENYVQRNQKGVFNYNYSMRAKPITPFKKVALFKPKALTLIRDFNFSLAPEMISFRTDLNRVYNERTARDNSGLNIEMPTTVQKDFLWNRYFDLRYSPSSALKIDFTNRNTSRIDELDGVINKDLYPDEYALMMDEIYKNISNFGRPTDYQHTINIDYRVPINKLPLLEWTNAQLNYKGSYDWMAGPVLPQRSGEESIDIGNTIGNNMNIRANGQLNFLTLYNYVPYFKKVNNRFQSSRRSYGSRSRTAQQKRPGVDDKKDKKTKEVEFTDKKVAFRVDVPKSIFHRLGTEDVNVVVINEKGDTIAGEVSVVDANRLNFKSSVGVRSGTVIVTGTKVIEEAFVEKALAYSTRFLLGVRSARITYSQTGATKLPGFKPDPYLFGMRNDESTDNMLAPTIPFLLGWQNSDFALQAAENNWITTDTTITKQYMLQNSETWNFNLQVEPIANIKIDITGSHRNSKNTNSEIYYNNNADMFELIHGIESGNFDMTILTLGTLFKDKIGGDEKHSVVFEEFNNNRQIILDRLNAERGWNDQTGYTKYGGDMRKDTLLRSTSVIIPAFLAAYTGADAHKIPLTARPGLSSIRPNWRINYNGNPESIEWMKDIIHSLNFNHSYKSTYSIGKFETNLAYQPDENGLSWTRDELYGSFIPELSITSVNIQEAFSPLINVDVGFVNDFSARFEISKTRNLNFDFTANKLNEMNKNEYSVGLGYRFTGMDMIIKTRKKSEEVSNDMNLRLDITGSNYKNVLRKLDDPQLEGELNGGAKIFSIDFQADYMVSDKLNVKLYYQYNINSPHNTMNGNARSNTKFGLSFNFSIM